MLSDEAYAALVKHKRKDESFSDVVKRLVPPLIETFGDLEKHLDNLEGPLNVDFDALERTG
jgi:predicted CopG family antitoxin